MDRDEAKRIAAEHLAPYRKKTYAELARMVGSNSIVVDLRDSKGQECQVEIRAFWDSRKGKDIRVMASAFEVPIKPLFWKVPLLRWIPISGGGVIEDFIISPTGKFVGERRQT